MSIKSLPDGFVTEATNVSSGGGTVTHTGTLTANELLLGNGGADLKAVAATNGQIPIGSSVDGSVQLATLTAGVNITVTNSAHGITIAANGGTGGTGNSIYNTAVGSEPGSPNSGDADFYSNGVWVSRYNGAWAPWGPIWPLANPAVQTWSWVNQGGATIDTTYGATRLTGVAEAGPSLRCRVMTAPATPYTMTAGLIPQGTTDTYCDIGVGWRESGSGKIVTYAFTTDVAGGTGVLTSGKWTNATTYSGAGYTLTADYRFLFIPILWLRLSDDGVTRQMWWSADGLYWVSVHSVARTDFLTPDQLLFFVKDQNSTYTPALTLLSWALA